jgi:hypothetical protein
VRELPGHCERQRREAIQFKAIFRIWQQTALQFKDRAVSARYGFFVSCSNTLATTQYYRKQPANVPFAGAVSFTVVQELAPSYHVREERSGSAAWRSTAHSNHIIVSRAK